MRAVATDAQGQHMVTAGADGQVKVWDVRKLQPMHSYFSRAPADTLDISQRGMLAVGFGRNVQVRCCTDVSFSVSQAKNPSLARRGRHNPKGTFHPLTWKSPERLPLTLMGHCRSRGTSRLISSSTWPCSRSTNVQCWTWLPQRGPPITSCACIFAVLWLEEGVNKFWGP